MRLEVDDGRVLNAACSYGLEEPKTILLSDLVIGFHDASGPGILAIEARRTSEKLPKGILLKDDRLQGAYLQNAGTGARILRHDRTGYVGAGLSARAMVSKTAALGHADAKATRMSVAVP